MDALRFANVLCKPNPNAQNISSWLTNFWTQLSTTFPGLKDSEKCKICISRFPQDIGESLSNAEVSEKATLFENAVALFAPGEHSIEANRARFYGTCPQKGMSLIAFINTLSNLSLQLDLSRAARENALIKRVIAFFPPYFRSMVNMKVDTLERLGKTLSIMTALADILANPQAVSEIEKSFCPPPRNAQVNQSKCEEKEKRKDREFRCFRCGSKKHEGGHCPVYTVDSLGKVCQLCYDLFGYTHKHRETDCAYAKN